MLRLDQQIVLPGLRGVRVYADDRRAERFYAFPAAPQVARDASGTPEISLLLYGRKSEGRFEATGGQLTLTTRLRLGDAEVETVRDALRERLRGERGLPPDAAIEVEIASPDWSDGEVEVRLGNEIVLRGAPSLAGGNEAALAVALDGQAVAKLRPLWDAGLSKATVHYRLTAPAAQRSVSGGESRTYTATRGTNDERSEEIRIRASLERTTTTPLRVEAEGPLRLSTAETRAAVQEVGL